MIYVCRYHGDSAGLLKACFSGESYPSCLKLYMEAVYKLGYQDKPNYCKLKQLFTKELKDLSCHGHVEDKLDWIKTSPSKVSDLSHRFSQMLSTPPDLKGSVYSMSRKLIALFHVFLYSQSWGQWYTLSVHYTVYQVFPLYFSHNTIINVS